LKIWGETKQSFLIILECLSTFEELYATSEYFLQKKRHKYKEIYTTQRQIGSNTHVVTVLQLTTFIKYSDDNLG
jgi:hypothetical protein